MYQDTTPIERAMHSIGKPLTWFYWRLIETLFYFQCRLGSHFGTRVSLVPKSPVEIDAFGESTQAPKPEFFRLARTGHIDLHRTSVERFTENGLQLGDGNALDLDTVVWPQAGKPILVLFPRTSGRDSIPEMTDFTSIAIS